MNATGPTESALAMEVVTDDERTTMEALRIAAASIFSALGYFLGGYFLARDDFVTPFLVASILYLVATLVFWSYFRSFDALGQQHASDIPTSAAS